MWITILTLSFSFLMFYAGTQLLIKSAFQSKPENNDNFSFIPLLKFSLILSAPAIFIASSSIITGNGGLVSGSILGSNLFNLSITLGISSFIRPVYSSLKLNKYLIILLIIASLSILFVFNDRIVSRTEGLLLVLTFLSFSFYHFWKSKSVIHLTQPEIDNRKYLPARKWKYSISYLLAGLTAIFAGAWLIIAQTQNLTASFGFGSTLFGFIILSAGISIPLLINVLRSNSKGNTDLATGIVFLSSTINIMVALGISAIVNPVKGYALSNIDLYAFAGLSLFQLQLLRKKFKLNRDEAIFQIIVYLMYMYYLLPK
jgi:cation:H+ antiporter